MGPYKERSYALSGACSTEVEQGTYVKPTKLTVGDLMDDYPCPVCGVKKRSPEC